MGDKDHGPAQAETRRELFEAREKRAHPDRDEKVPTAWNGLMLAACAEAAGSLDRDDYRQVAEKNAAFLLRELRQVSGRLLRTWKTRSEQGHGRQALLESLAQHRTPTCFVCPTDPFHDTRPT